MKKSVFVFAFAALFGWATIGSSSAALKTNNHETLQTELTQEAKESSFKAIELDDLPEAVEEAAKKEGTRVKLESAERKVLPNGTYVYRVTMEVDDRRQVSRSFYADGRKYDR